MIEYPPPYECLVWDYKHSDENAIARALHQVDWNFLFFNKNVHEQVSILNRTLINVFSNFIPNKLVTFKDKDPPWMTSNLRHKINWKNSIYKDFKMAKQIIIIMLNYDMQYQKYQQQYLRVRMSTTDEWPRIVLKHIGLL